MILIPAIDLLDGQCVRLQRGDFDACQVYPAAPADLASAYRRAGAEWLHLVDLAASRDGEAADTRPLFDLLSAVRQNVQTGGGVRNEQDIVVRLEAGADRVVVGSVAGDEPERFAQWLQHFGPDKLVAALDVRTDEDNAPRVRSHGWTRDSGRSLWELLDYFETSSLLHLLCTDISRDGLMGGPNLGLYQSIHARYPNLQVQASGGVRDVGDLSELAATGCSAAISGKALLDKKFSIGAALEALS